MAKKRITQYTRNRNRILSSIRRVKKKTGYTTKLYFPTEKELRKQGVKGKELSALTRELKKWKSKDIKEYIEKENIHRENKNEDDSFFTRTVITQWYAKLLEFSNGEAYSLLRAWMGSIIRENGKNNVAIMLQDGAEQGNILTWETVYKTDSAMLYIGYMLDYLPDSGVLYKEETLDRLEYMKRLGEALEESEDWEYPY